MSDVASPLTQRTDVRPSKRQLPEEPQIPTSARAHLPQAAVLVALAGVSGLVSIVFWPGLMDEDTLAEIQNAISGRFTDWHAPILEAMWRLAYLAGLHSPGWILWASMFTLLVGFYLILRARFSRLISTIIAGVCYLFPPVLTWATHVGVDAWFAAFLVSSFGFALRSTRKRDSAKVFCITMALILIFLCEAATHNALVVIPVLLFIIAALTLPRHLRHRNFAVCMIAIIGTAALYLAQYGIEWKIATKSTNPVQTVLLYDLALMSKAEHKVLLPKSIDPGQNLSTIDKLAYPQTMTALLFGKTAIVNVPLEGAQYNDLVHAWERALIHYPTAYLSERFRTLTQLFSMGTPSYWLYDPPGVLPQYPIKFTSLDNFGVRYLSSMSLNGNNLEGDIFYDIWIYMLLLTVAIVILIKRNIESRVIAALAIAVLIYAIVSAFVVPVVMYRFVYPVVTVCVVVIPVLAPRSFRR